MIVGGCYFNHIKANNIQICDAAQDLQCSGGTQSTDDRRTRARRKSRIQAVDIETQVGRRITDPSLDSVDNRLRRLFIGLVRVNNLKRVIGVIVLGPYANLERTEKYQ